MEASARAVEDRLWSLARPSPRGARPTLERMRHLLAALGDPHTRLQAIHVGGTSGKGSTAHLIAAMLDAAGYSTGLHTKPHLTSVQERFVIGGQPIDWPELARLLDAAAPMVERLAAAGESPTWFELVVALCFQWFAKRGAAPAVVEVGLGGAWDATNLLAPLVAVLTNVGLDHMDVLGDTVEQIAADKAGIFKPGMIAITGVKQPTVQALIDQRARAVGIPLWRLGHEIQVTVRSADQRGSCFDLEVPGRAIHGLKIGMLGGHQVENAALAVAAVTALADGGFPVDDDAIRRGLAACRVPGRMEVVASAPTVLLDGAHNPDKMAAFVAALRELFPDQRPVFVVAMRRGHDTEATLAPLVSIASALIFTRITSEADWGREESVDPDLLRGAVDWAPGVQALVEPDATVALEHAKTMAGRTGLVCVTGSLYLVGELRQRLVSGQRAP